LVTAKWLQAQGVLRHADDVWVVLIYPHAVMLSDHVRAGVAHLLSIQLSKMTSLAGS
jgi:hypothetical protein